MTDQTRIMESEANLEKTKSLKLNIEASIAPPVFDIKPVEADTKPTNATQPSVPKSSPESHNITSVKPPV